MKVLPTVRKPLMVVVNQCVRFPEMSRVGVWSVERRLGVRFKADVDEGGAGCFWLLHSGRRGVLLLRPLLLRKVTLCLVSQTVLLLFLLFLQDNRKVLVIYDTDMTRSSCVVCTRDLPLSSCGSTHRLRTGI